MAVRGVDHDGVDAGFHQGFDTLFRALAHAHRRAHAQAAGGVTRGKREAGLLGDVLHRDQALEFVLVVNDQQAFQLELVQQRLGFLGAGAFVHRDQLVARRHDFVHRHVVAGFKAQIAPGHDADNLAAFEHRKAGNAQLLRQVDHLAHRMARRDHHRVAQHARLVALHTRDFGGLLLGRQVLVHDANAAFLGDRNR